VGGPDLKQRLIEAWSCIPQTVIDEDIDEWALRLRACVKANGTSLRAFDVTNRLFSETPNAIMHATTGFFRATHILSKKIAVPSYA